MEVHGLREQEQHRGHTHRHHEEHMISVEEALERILSCIPVLEAEERPILEALGQVLAQDVVAQYDIPPLANSAMDGYAVRWESIQGASFSSPKVLKVIGQVAAGELPREEVTPGTAIRIMTGAPIPPGADTVVPFEETDELERKAGGEAITHIAIRRVLERGANVRLPGEDMARGERVLQKGRVLRPVDIGVLATLGYDRVQVLRRPVVTIIATGDELMEPGEPLAPGKIYNSNSYTVAAFVLQHGGVPRVLGIARDNWESLNSKVEEGLQADLLITSAGVSKGDYDIVKDILAHRGEVTFWSVRMKPAKPIAFGFLYGPQGRRVPHLGLPGNPVSALIACEVFLRPSLYKMMGRPLLPRPVVTAVLETPIYNNDGRRVYARVRVRKEKGRLYARLTGPQGSHVLTSVAKANGLAICPEDVEELKAGQVVQVIMMDWPEEVGELLP